MILFQSFYDVGEGEINLAGDKQTELAIHPNLPQAIFIIIIVIIFIINILCLIP